MGKTSDRRFDWVAGLAFATGAAVMVPSIAAQASPGTARNASTPKRTAMIQKATSAAPQRAALRRSGELQLTLFGPIEHPLVDELRELDINELTPLAALAKLKAWQDELAEKTASSRSR